MGETVQGRPEGGGSGSGRRIGRLTRARGPGRLGTRLACRASIALAMACTASTIGRSAEGLARLVVPPGPRADVAAALALSAGCLVVAALAWATFRLLVLCEDMGMAQAEGPRLSILSDGRIVGLPELIRYGDAAHDPSGEFRRDDTHFWTILETSRAVAYMKDCEGRYVRVNRQCSDLFDPQRKGMIGKDDFAIFPEELASAFAQNDRRVLEGRVPVELEEVAPHADGPHTYLSIKVPLFDADGDAYGICGISTDITERKELERRLAEQLELARAANDELERRGDELAVANARLAELATTDGLTSLINRRHFDEVIEAEVATAVRDGTPLSVLMLDLDGFKAYNDAFGHPAGDRVLQTVADILRDHIRARDRVARYGGEEFIALLPATDGLAARTIAERLRSAIEDWPWPNQPLTASIGIATFAGGLGDAQGLIDLADQALYHSKAAGRNRITHHGDIAPVASTCPGYEG